MTTVSPILPAMCLSTCKPGYAFVCGTDGTTYMSDCHLKKLACRADIVISIRHRGVCQPYSSRVVGDTVTVSVPTGKPNTTPTGTLYRYTYIIYILKTILYTINTFLSSRIINTICRVSSFHVVLMKARKFVIHRSLKKRTGLIFWRESFDRNWYFSAITKRCH